ncbi:MAG: transposase [Bacteroidota bacterium]|nr:transposase [Bacteroidota bacterium]MDP3144904.1 transposase [Bacteroidota bacterium]
MRKSKFTDQEIEVALSKIEKGTSIEDTCKKMGVTLATVYNWKKKFQAANNPVPSNKTKELEEENFRLRQLVANLSLEKLDLITLLQKKSK